MPLHAWMVDAVEALHSCLGHVFEIDESHLLEWWWKVQAILFCDVDGLI